MEYFFKRLFEGVKKVIRGAVEVVGEVASKAGDVLKDVASLKLGQYAFGDDESYAGCLVALSRDVDEKGKRYIESGILLCPKCDAKKRLAERYEEFVKRLVGAF